jgi:hypothetical protein
MRYQGAERPDTCGHMNGYSCICSPSGRKSRTLRDVQKHLDAAALTIRYMYDNECSTTSSFFYWRGQNPCSVVRELVHRIQLYDTAWSGKSDLRLPISSDFLSLTVTTFDTKASCTGRTYSASCGLTISYRSRSSLTRLPLRFVTIMCSWLCVAWSALTCCPFDVPPRDSTCVYLLATR